MQPPISIDDKLLTEDEATTCATMHDTAKAKSSASVLLSRRFCSNRPTSMSRRFRCRTTSNGQQTDFSPPQVTRSTSIFSHINLIKWYQQYQNKDDVLLRSFLLVLLFVLPFSLGYYMSRWSKIVFFPSTRSMDCLFVRRTDQPSMDKFVIELDRVNQRLNGLSSTSARLMEKELTEQVNTLTLQIQRLREDLQRTEETLALRIDQLTLENHRLREEFQTRSSPSKIDEETAERPFEDIPVRSTRHATFLS